MNGLVFPENGHGTLTAARSLYLTETIRRFLRAGETLPPDLKQAHRRLARRVAKTLASDARALAECFAVPNVGAPIHCSFHQSRWPRLSSKIASAFQDSLPHLLLEMAVRGLFGEAETFEWEAAAPRLASPAIQALIIPPADAFGWTFSANGIAVLGGRGRGAFLRLNSSGLLRGRREVQGLRSELAYIPVAENISLALVDPSPIAETETHPEKSGNVLDLGDHSEDDWRSSLQTALAWIQEAAPALFREMQALGLQIVPIGFHAERHCSASYQEAIGVIYMTLHPNPLVMAEALIHEFQHNKLNLASYRDGVLKNAFEPLYASPVRPDPRPLWGVLLAAHAFVPVAVFYRRLEAAGHAVSRTPEFKRRLQEIDRQNQEALETLEKNADWTTDGKQLWTSLSSLSKTALSST